ncbi:hypothetical protein BC941DRAFT_436820 [Chlamydoabsidia padenii]|nr:hypothetical protein BC941DRAFT_436820 [Chlamydoabsidia padenii]
MTEAIVNSLRSTRQPPPPPCQLKRPLQKPSLPDLLTTCATDLLGSVATTLKDHSERYHIHLEQQRQVYATYINTLGHHPTHLQTTVTKPCDKQSSCKQPATFSLPSTTLNQDAMAIWKQATSYYLKGVDSRVCIQTLVGTSRINSMVDEWRRPGLEKKDRDTLVGLAWDCLDYLWQQLGSSTGYPPIKLFLQDTSQSLATMISSHRMTMDRLVTLFESDHDALVFLYHAFDPNCEHQALFVQRYQQITLLASKVLEKTAYHGPALEYLIRSFDVGTWCDGDTALDEAERQSFYLSSCHFIQQEQMYDKVDDNNNLVDLCISHMMVIMSSFVHKQQESNQGEHLYVLHLLIDTLANTTNSMPLARALDAFTKTLCQRDPYSIIVTQEDWKQQHQPDIKLKCGLLNDPGRTLDVLLSILSQFNSAGALKLYGPSGCISLARLIFALLLDNRMVWTLGLLARSFDVFWKPCHDNNQVGHYSENTSHPQTTNAQLYITHLFALALDILVNDESNDDTINLMNDLDHYCHHVLLDEMGITWLALFLPMIGHLPWHSTSEMMLNRCLDLRQHDRPKYMIYLPFVFTMLEQTIIKDQRPLDHHHYFFIHVKLAFVLLMDADSTWPQQDQRTNNLKKLWQSIIEPTGRLEANDMKDIVTTTRIDEPSNWGNSIDKSDDGNTLIICIQWMRHLTTGDTASMGLITVFGRFILAHLNKGSVDATVRVNWYKVLMKQADDYMARHPSDLPDCVEWFKVLVADMMETNGKVVDMINESTSNDSTALAIFMACIPCTPLPERSIHTRILVMEHCLERCQDQDIWSRVGPLLQDAYFGQGGAVEASISEHIRYSIDVSCLLVLTAYCHAKLYRTSDQHVAEEIAAILSMADGDTRKRIGLVQLFGKLLSRNKETTSLDSWLASSVSLARSCTRWSGLPCFAIVLQCFLASRLSLMGIPPYSDNKTTDWVCLLEQHKKNDGSHKKLYTFAIHVVQHPDKWTLWDLDGFITQTVDLLSV